MHWWNKKIFMGFGERDDYNNKLHVVQFLQSLKNNNKKTLSSFAYYSNCFIFTENSDALSLK